MGCRCAGIRAFHRPRSSPVAAGAPHPGPLPGGERESRGAVPLSSPSPLPLAGGAGGGRSGRAVRGSPAPPHGRDRLGSPLSPRNKSGHDEEWGADVPGFGPSTGRGHRRSRRAPLTPALSPAGRGRVAAPSPFPHLLPSRSREGPGEGGPAGRYGGLPAPPPSARTSRSPFLSPRNKSGVTTGGKDGRCEPGTGEAAEGRGCPERVRA